MSTMTLLGSQPQAVLTVSSSNATDGPPPPRYSTLLGTISPSAADMLRSMNAGAAALASANDPNSDIEFTERRPPGYWSVYQRSGNRIRQRGPGCTSDSVGASDANSACGPETFEYHIKSGSANKAAPWATLKVFSRSSAALSTHGQAPVNSGTGANAGKMPRFTSQDLVQGTLELKIEAPQSINSISLSLRGRVITSSYDGGSYTFLDHSIVNWTRTNGDPRSGSTSPTLDSPPSSASSSASGSSSSSSSRNSSPMLGSGPRPKKFEGKLSGEYTWPFSFPFPSEVVIPGQGRDADRTSPSPQNFLEKVSTGNVQYDLVLRMTHGMLRADSKLTVGLVYVPDVTPPASSVLRQLAYGQGERIPGPEVDPFGWHTLPPAIIRGRLLNAQNVKLQCSLSLANPLSYTRGTVIPLHLTIQSAQPEALDQVANRKAISARLVRKVEYYEDAAHSLSRRGRQMSSGSESGSDLVPEGLKEEVVVMEKAIWWTPAIAEHSNERDPYTRYFEGEIHLEKELQPSCGFLLFKVSYTVELLPFKTSLFRASSSTAPILTSQPITIATLHSEGPLPVSVTKPRSHRTPRSERNQDYEPRISPDIQMLMRH